RGAPVSLGVAGRGPRATEPQRRQLPEQEVVGPGTRRARTGAEHDKSGSAVRAVRPRRRGRLPVAVPGAGDLQLRLRPGPPLTAEPPPAGPMIPGPVRATVSPSSCPILLLPTVALTRPAPR